MIVPADEMLFDCEDVLDRLLPCIRQILDYLRAQGRHPDTSLLAPTELFRATGLYFTGDEINRLLEAFNGEPLADQVRAGSYGMPVRSSPSYAHGSQPSRTGGQEAAAAQNREARGQSRPGQRQAEASVAVVPVSGRRVVRVVDRRLPRRLTLALVRRRFS